MVKGLFLAWFIGSSAADSVTTELALRRPGVTEVNTFMQGGPVERITLRSGVTTSATIIFIKLWPHHPKLTAIAVSALSGEFTVLAIHNGRIH